MVATRRLAAIMFTDMVGFTTSTQTDEASALSLLQEQEELVHPLFVAHQGREIKSTGDGSLVEFDSALRAVQCAIDIQQHLQERNSHPGVPPIRLRIGVHLGDVEERAGDIFGDSVNLASRIQPFAEPGGICISETVFDLVRNKVPNQLERLEPKVLKGVLFPVEIYRVHLAWTAKELPSRGAGPTRLAVLPFANISPDPRDEYFADGLTEEVITVLSQLRELRVIARTSVNQYKSTAKPVSQIGAELSVDAILEGSVRKAGDDLRITVQLIDVGTQEHTWANTYDRKLEKVFAVQAELAKQVAEALKIGVRAAEAARLDSRPPVGPDSYLAYLKGRTLMRSLSEASLKAAKGEFERAISLDPQNAAAHSGLADVTHYLTYWFPHGSSTESEATIRRLVTRAIELDPNLAEAHASLAVRLLEDWDYARGERELKHALSLNPSNSQAHQWYALMLEELGRVDEALAEFALAEASDPLLADTFLNSGQLLIWLGRFDEALVKIQRYGKLEPALGGMYHALMAHYFIARSDTDQALREIRRTEKFVTKPGAKAHLLAWYHIVAGEENQGRAFLRQLEALPEDLLATQFIADLYADLGDLDECFRWLEKTVETREISMARWRLDPRLEHVRRDPRFQTLLKKMNLA